MCPICAADLVSHFFRCTRRKYDYFSCSNCKYIFLSKENFLDPTEEKRVYDFHQNDPQDEAYRNFLNQLVSPLKNHLVPRNQFVKGLDFGCGPGPTLHLMLEDLGLKMDLYDPIYYPNQKLLKNSYDLITSSEVFEHFKQPIQEFGQIYEAIRPGGLLAVMTEFYHPGRDFANWHYIKYHTHVGFYSRETFTYLAERFGMTPFFYIDRVAILKKNL